MHLIVFVTGGVVFTRMRPEHFGQKRFGSIFFISIFSPHS